MKVRNENYYTVPKILEIIKEYRSKMDWIKEVDRDIKSVGVAQYGIEASLPKSNSVSSAVEKEALRQIENNVVFSSILTDIKYVQQRWDRVTSERDAQVLSLRLDGYKATDIAQVMNMERSNVHRVLKRIACQIKGYPQEDATNSTNYKFEKEKVYN